MNTLLTRCPHCTTVFRVRAEQLAAARGQVRCGVCGNLFHALDDLLEQLPEPAAAAPQPLASEVPRALDAPEERLPSLRREDAPSVAPRDEDRGREAGGDMPALRLGTAEELDDAPTPRAPPRVDVDALLRLPEALPPELEPEPVRARGARWPWRLGALLMLGLLALQLVWFRHAELVARWPALAEPVGWLCERLGCVQPAPAEPGDVRLESRDLRLHPQWAGMLRLEATLRNAASGQRPYPTLQLTLLDASGALIGRRRFDPAQYLTTLPVGARATLAAGQAAEVALDVVDPGDRAVSFEIDLL